MRRINITLDDIVDDKAIEFCKLNNITRSALISTALTQYISAMEQMPKLKEDLQAQIDELRELVANLGNK